MISPSCDYSEAGGGGSFRSSEQASPLEGISRQRPAPGAQSIVGLSWGRLVECMQADDPS